MMALAVASRQRPGGAVGALCTRHVNIGAAFTRVSQRAIGHCQLPQRTDGSVAPQANVCPDVFKSQSNTMSTTFRLRAPAVCCALSFLASRSKVSSASAGYFPRVRRRFCTSEEQPRERWDLTGDNIDFKYTDEDKERFSSEREKFRHDSRLQPDELPVLTGTHDMDVMSTLKYLASVLRLTDLITEPFKDRIIERLTENAPLVEHFGIPQLEDQDSNKGLHNKKVPVAGNYFKVRMQAYWLAMHIWLIHRKQYLVQEGEGVFGSAICAYITRHLFEWQWNQLRGFLHDADVPAMSLTIEVQDLQEYIFGFCLSLDTVFREEAPEGTASALSVEGELPTDRFGLAPRVKHALWANVYSGKVPHDDPRVYELTVYILRQRAALETLPRASFFAGQFSWAAFSW
eukprot:TRINITY_DN67548_c0_g1_i1.p1 TRINITY_DN67548_c0_g1~~TRINITY_DN67548_c0_g1_i1.p1  ORF type:complete len:422 (-),score=48.82 TRINITY_DN67548_c0_g1_i1:353-1558(-)